MPNTPKKYKGFSKLPEDVQQKMDPEAAMKYMEGGAVGVENVRPKSRPENLERAEKKKRMDEEKRTKKRIIKESTRRRTRDHNTEPKQDIKSALGFANGGKVRGYKHGGGVCRGGGAAISGTKFAGVK